MFSEEFNKIFAELEEIEEKLESTKDHDYENIKKQLINLRSSIDECIGYWIGFEEKLWELQEKYNIDIPDQLDESLVMAYLDVETTQDDQDILNEILSMEASDKSQNCNTKEKPSPIETLERGLGYFDLLMYDEAEKELEKAINSNPNMSIAHFFLGLVNSEKGNFEKGLKELRLVLALIEDDEMKGVIYNFIGNIYVKQHELEKALINFSRACECSPNFFDANFNLGATYFNLGKFNKSESAFNNALQIKEDDWEAHLSLGKALCYQGKFHEALNSYKRALTLNPKEARIHFEIGLVHELLQNEETARHEYEKAKNCLKERNDSNTNLN